MLTLFLIATAASFALSFIIWPLMSKRAPAQSLKKINTSEENLRIYQAQHAELAEELEAGRLSQEDFAASEQELAERLEQEELAAIADSNAASNAGTSKAAAPIKPAYLIIIIALFLGLTAGIYYATSESSVDALDNLAAQTPPPPPQDLPEDHPNITGPDIEKMVAGLAERLKAEPDNQEGWVMLGRSYLVLGRYNEAAQAYERASRLSVEDDAELLTNFAETLAFSNNGIFTAEARALLTRALKAAPTHPKALWYAGISAFESGEYTQAITHWETLKKHAPPEVVNKVLDDNIARARNLANPTPEPAPKPAPAVDSSVLNISVALADRLLDKVTPKQTLFIFVKSTDGQPMPLAVTRRTVSDLPLTITLSDKNAMMPSRKLSDFADYFVTARISQSGTATLTTGDLVGKATAVRGQTATVEILIDTTAE